MSYAPPMPTRDEIRAESIRNRDPVAPRKNVILTEGRLFRVFLVDSGTAVSPAYRSRGKALEAWDAIENAGRLPAATYRRSTMFTTLSPCFMCAGTILLYGIPRVVIGENATFLGAEGLLRQQGVELVVLDSAECRQLMREFIAAEPGLWHEDIGEVQPG